MPLSPAGGPAGSGFNGGVVTGQVVLSEANPLTTPLQARPGSGATAASKNQIEVYDDAGNLLWAVDAAGTLGFFSAGTPTNNILIYADGGLDYESADRAVVLNSPTAGKAGLMFWLPTAQPDTDLGVGWCSLWFDATNGAPKLMVKARQANGVYVTGSLALAP